jgi:hypothetical protein
MKLKYGWVYRSVYKTIVKYISKKSELLVYWIAFRFDKLVSVMKAIFK